MPSLIDPGLSGSKVNVAANYLKMPAQGTYGVGTYYSNFATRQLRFVTVAATKNASALDFRLADGTTGADNTGFMSAVSIFQKAVRAVQIVGEVYYISEPNATGFVVAVAEDTVNDSDTTGNIADATSYGDLEAAVVAALAALPNQVTGTVVATVSTKTISA